MTAVARAWTMDLATMASIEIADEIPSCFTLTAEHAHVSGPGRVSH